MSRIAFFRNSVAQAGLDASQNQLINTLSGQYALLSSEVLAKASAQSVTDLTNDVSGKASTAALNNLTAQVLLKASSGTVADLQTLVNSKASSDSVTAVNDAVLLRATQTTVANLSNVVDGKVGQSVYNSRIANEAIFFEAVNASISLQTPNNVDINYVALGLIPAPQV